MQVQPRRKHNPKTNSRHLHYVQGWYEILAFKVVKDSKKELLYNHSDHPCKEWLFTKPLL